MIKGGWIRDKPDPRDFRAKRQFGDYCHDLRDTGFLPPIYQQYDTNACTSMSIGAAIEYMTKKEGKPEFKPSKLFIYWNARMLSNCTDRDDGAEIRDAFKSLSRWGSAPDADLPFLHQNIQREPPQKAYDDAKKEVITQYSRLSSTASDIMFTIMQGKPVVFGFEMYENLQDDDVIKTGNIKMPKGKHLGGHCMLIVGVAKTGNYVIVRNSWGEEWGDKGYGTIPIDYIENDNLTGDFWTIDVV